MSFIRHVTRKSSQKLRENKQLFEHISFEICQENSNKLLDE